MCGLPGWVLWAAWGYPLSLLELLMRGLRAMHASCLPQSRCCATRILPAA
jgi:hypothetical protein